MAHSADNNSVTKLNTQLNTTMVLMENVTDPPAQNHKRKSITISTKTQPNGSKRSPIKSHKSILKKPDNSFSENNGSVQLTNGDVERSNDIIQRSSSTLVSSRPHTLEELIQKETLTELSTSPTFNLEDISDNEEIWIMDLPKVINPQELRSQTIALEDKSKIKIKDERYCIVANNESHNVTCIFNTERGYKTVNINAVGTLSVRRKLSGAPELKPVPVDNSGVQFPYNLKSRHPLFGVVNENMSSRKKKSKKHSLKV